MAIVKPIEGLHSLRQAQKIGQPNGLGEHVLGWSELGHHDDYAGYYQKRRGKTGTIIVRMRPYWPPQNPGEPEQARRASFGEGVAHWQGLTATQKMAYDREAEPLHWSGFNLHQSRWLKGEIS